MKEDLNWDNSSDAYKKISRGKSILENTDLSSKPLNSERALKEYNDKVNLLMSLKENNGDENEIKKAENELKEILKKLPMGNEHAN